MDEDDKKRREAQSLFEGQAPGEPNAGAPAKPLRAGAPRLRVPNRAQVELRAQDLESLLPEGHRARTVWGYVERQKLDRLYADIRAREGVVGRDAIDPRVLFALWLYATLEGIGSARELARMTQEHDGCRWICGGIQVSYRTLAKWRVGHGEVLDELLTENLATLASVGVVKLARVAQDGMRVRASAGAASFRREQRLEAFLQQAQARVVELKAQIDSDPGAGHRKAQAARLRAAREREQRIQRALDRLPELAAVKRRTGKNAAEARASTTDAQASTMKMADGGFRPAYNVQLASDCEAQVIVGVAVVTSGSDMAQLAPMVEQVEQRLGRAPEQWLVDGGYPGHGQLDAVADKTEVYAPVPEPRVRAEAGKAPGRASESHSGAASSASADESADEPALDKHAPKPGDSAAVAQWRARMASAQAQAIYRDRAATAECVNAQARNRGLWQMPVRGLRRVLCVARLYALAHNVMRMAVLAPELIGCGRDAPAAIANG